MMQSKTPDTHTLIGATIRLMFEKIIESSYDMIHAAGISKHAARQLIHMIVAELAKELDDELSQPRLT
jgi:hypothetical protein